MAVMLFGEFAAKKGVISLRILEWSDKYSYDVYITHMIYIKGVLSVLDLTDNYIVNILFMLILTALSAMMLHRLCEILKIIMLNLAENK